MADTKTPLEENRFYHIYNHAVGNELLFTKEDNYKYFLMLIEKYLLNCLDIFSYCLMPNHFHLVIRIKDALNIEIANPTRVLNPRRVFQTSDVPTLISKQFSNLFNSYAQAFNKQQQRKGSLFNNRFKRIHIGAESYLLKLIHYIHYNPVEANLCSTISEWKYSSFNAIMSNKKTFIKRSEVLELFGDKENFNYFHKISPILSGIDY